MTMTPPAPTRVRMLLTQAQAGQRLRVSGIDGGQGLRARLFALGLTPGTPVEVVSADAGAVILDIKGGRLMLGRGTAAQIRVREASPA